MTTKLTPQEIFACAAKLLISENAWTKGEYARTADGEPITVQNEAAASFCVLGAIRKCIGDRTGDYDEGCENTIFDACEGRLRASLRGIGVTDIPDWNDNLATHDEVVARLTKLSEEGDDSTS